MTLSDNQKRHREKMLANLRTPDDHNSATGRRFKLQSPPLFSSRLSRTEFQYNILVHEGRTIKPTIRRYNGL